MKVIKVSTPWNHIDFLERIPSDLAEYRFIFDISIEECDFWIIWGGIKAAKETAICNSANIIYLTDEVHEQRFFNKKFLDQFAAIITCRTDLEHSSIISNHELNTWMVDRDYDWLHADREIPKSKTLSVISSDQTWLPGHKIRYAFINKLIGHFKDKLDVFGRGFNPVEDKFDALSDYKYSIAIENSVIPGYFTEKITDCYLTHTMPLYYGCPDIDQYFDIDSFRLIDPNNFKDSVLKIEQIIEEDKYNSVLPLLKIQKKRYLEEYHIFNKLVKIIENEFKPTQNKSQITIKNERCFQKGYSINKRIDSVFKKLHLPSRFYFQIKIDQTKTYANRQ